MSEAYARAGVDVQAGYEVVDRIRKHAARTSRAGVMGVLGGFGGCFDISQLGVREPVLVSGTDGVGTKIMVAAMADKHDTVGIDCVAMCVNDIVAQGAEPLFFLDYVATGHTVPAVIEQVVAGVADGCIQAGAALIGGETAEMPGIYSEDDYDLAGFAVGVAERCRLIDPANVQVGDVLLGLASSGVHSNGFTLVRKVFFEQADLSVTDELPEIPGKTLGEVLLEPTRIYVKPLLPLVRRSLVTGVAHVTGGGFDENLPRMMLDDLRAEIDPDTWPIPPIFEAIERVGQIERREMFQVFNMGIGMVLAVRPSDVERVVQVLAQAGETAYQIGRVGVTERDGERIAFRGNL